MDTKNIVFLIIFILAFGFFFYSSRNLIRYMFVAKKADNRLNKIGTRLLNVLKYAIGQKKLFRFRLAGILHSLIFWGFLLFLFAVVEALIQGFFPSFNYESTGFFYSLVTFIEDIFGALVMLAVLVAIYRRVVIKVPRLEVGKAGKLDALLILSLIFLVVLSMFGQSTALIAQNNFNLLPNQMNFIALPLSKLIYSGNIGAAGTAHEVFWWMHIVVVLGFLNYLPYSKHLHVLTSIPNTFFSNLSDVRNTLKPIDLEDENLETFGVADIEHLSWKQILDGYSCTECGRCESVCPAATVGKSLSPREVIVQIRKRTKDKAHLLANGIENEEVMSKTLVHDYIPDLNLWQCTTCMACVQECPVMIEHVDSIVDMRRDLVLTEAQFPSNLNNVFKSLETNYTPWAFNSADRANWAEGMDIKTMAQDSDGEILFWVGCAGSFDARYQKVTKAFAKLMQKGNIDFRILGTEEKCNGDTARRLGNEYLAQTLMKDNIEKLNGYNVKKIVTACPHCFHSLKNEYKQFGGNFEVLHHTELIEEMLNEGKLELSDNVDETAMDVTYHDSCYLGRYNNIFDSPRNSLGKVEKINYIEMKRNKTRGFCCGAGGGRMFLEDEEGGRINIERTKEALATGADTIASACPFCMTMITDGVKHFEKSEEVKVKDIAEIILENTK
ncbi:MAG TPA: 4Fe-4S dicluster domain-containing protein [Ignavibacteria bacterium]|nr:4Fe-4S dicluster domain-containing protein [Ignavibacteria bacterium]